MIDKPTIDGIMVATNLVDVESEFVCVKKRGVTYLGGEPFDPRNQAGLLELSKKLRAAYPQKSIWSFTGYVYGKNLPQVPGVTDALLASLDVLVDGPFIEEQKNLRLRFRGSENQRLIDMPQTLKAGTVVLWDEEQ